MDEIPFCNTPFEIRNGEPMLLEPDRSRQTAAARLTIADNLLVLMLLQFIDALLELMQRDVQ